MFLSSFHPLAELNTNIAGIKQDDEILGRRARSNIEDCFYFSVRQLRAEQGLVSVLQDADGKRADDMIGGEDDVSNDVIRIARYLLTN